MSECVVLLVKKHHENLQDKPFNAPRSFLISCFSFFFSSKMDTALQFQSKIRRKKPECCAAEFALQVRATLTWQGC
jgi:hypothetical protein